MPALNDRAAGDAFFRSTFENQASYVWASLARLGVRERDREDLVSEVFVRVHRESAAYDHARPIRPWLFAFAVRVASEYRKSARFRREVLAGTDDEHEHTDPAETADLKIERTEGRALVQAALEELDFDKRVVFVMHELDDTKVPEIAQTLGLAEGTAYSRLRAARTEFASAVRRLQLGGRRV